MLLVAPAGNAYLEATRATLRETGIRFEPLSGAGLRRRYPQIAFPGGMAGVFEPESGVLMARRAVQAVVRQAIQSGTDYRHEAIATPTGNGRLKVVRTAKGGSVRTGIFVFTCGPWLPSLFPDLLRGRIRPTRQEPFFFDTPPGQPLFSPPRMPVTIDFHSGIYSVPDLDGRGFKVGLDHHGPAFDPETGSRLITAASVRKIRRIMAERFPMLVTAPLVDSRVCQYENTANGDFLIDQHPEFENVWLAGGGSGHGFKHGPAVGEYVTAQIGGGGEVEPRFSLATKTRDHRRSVF